MAEVTQLPLNPPPKAGETPSRNAVRQRRYRAKKRKSVTRNAVTPAKAPQSEAVTQSRRERGASLPLTMLAYGFFALGISINVWNARTGTLADMALPAAMGVLAEGVMFFLPAWAIRLPAGRQLAAWALLVFVSAFALTNSLRMASIVAADQAMTRADRETAGTAQAGRALDVARSQRDVACGRGLGKTVACSDRQAEVAKLESKQVQATAKVAEQAKPEATDFAGLVSWMSLGALHPAGRDFDMLWLLFRTFLPQAGGLVLMLARR